MSACGRVLIFGAYGNGNLGDQIQAESLARAVKAVDPEIEVTAASFLQSSDFPFDQGDVASRDQLMDPDFVNQFDLMIVGGGGLLAHPHDPLHHAKWVDKLTLPTAIWGVGATDFYAPKAKRLIERSVFVSGRDLVSVQTLLQYRPHVVPIIDPVLADTHLRQTVPHDGFDRRAWVIAGPHQAIHEEIKPRVRDEDLIIGFEPSEDGKIEDLFPDIHYVDTTDDFFEATRGCRIISMRYHGTILGILGGNPVVSLARPKGADLLQLAGLGHLGVNHMHQIPAAWAGQETSRTLAIVDHHARMSRIYMQALLTNHLLGLTA